MTTGAKRLVPRRERAAAADTFFGYIFLNPINKLRYKPARDTWLAIAFAALIFLMGGGARADISSLVVLRPVAALMLAYGAFRLTRQDLSDFRAMFLLWAAIVAVCVAHVIPLPPALWGALPGRQVIQEIDAAAGVAGTWRPIALVPQAAWNALFSLMVPLAFFLIAIRLSNLEQRRLAYLMIAVAFASILVGLVQLQGVANGPAYLYRITNEGKLVGLFSNRNHNAIFLASVIPIFAYLASLPVRERSRLQLRLGLCVAGAISILAALVVIGSRAGFVFGVLGSLAAVMMYRSPKVFSRNHSDARWTFTVARYGRLVGLAVVVVVAVGLFAFSSSETMERVQSTEAIDEKRFKVIEPLLQMSWKYFPVGSGVGSFVETFKMDEPLTLLGPKYLNHAHNDYLEILLTVGLPGIVLVVIGLGLLGIATVAAFTRDATNDESLLRARLGAVICGMLALASFADYPLRTPSLACFFVIASVWLGSAFNRQRAEGTLKNA